MPTLEEYRENFEAAGLSPEEGLPDDFELKTVEHDADDIDELVDQYHVGGGKYELPGGNNVNGKTAAVAVVTSHFDRLENDDGLPRYICIQHPEMSVYGPVYDEDGNKKYREYTDADGRPKRQMLSRKYGEFDNGQFVPRDDIDLEDENVQEVLDNMDYVIRE